MKKLVLIFCLLFLFTSCKKTIVGPYQQVPDPIDTTTWQDGYTSGGILPGGGTQTQNQMIGTKWVLVKVVSAFSTNYPNDTITFISNNKYVLNQNAQRPYVISSITGSTNKSLTLEYFYPFGGSQYSGQVGQYFVEDGFLRNREFTDLQNNTATLSAWLVKI
jgi:hypothetical protein